MRKIDEINLPSYVSRNMFDCFEQQIITMCILYRNEFWKLFLRQCFEYKTDGDRTLGNLYRYRSNLVKSANKEYGIYLEKKDNIEDIYTNRDRFVLTEVSSKSYEYTQDIEEEGTHFLIVCGEEEDKFIINDNYYNVCKNLVDKSEFAKGIVSLQRIVDREPNYTEVDTAVLDFFSNDIYGEFLKICDSLVEEYDYSSELIDFITILYKYCFRYAVVIKGIDNDEHKDYLNVCASIIEKQVTVIQNTLYAVMKDVIKDKYIGCEDSTSRILALGRNVKIIQNCIDQVLLILKREKSLVDLVKNEIKKYEVITDEIENLDINSSVYDVHDKLTILFLLNFLEDENPGIKIEYDEINGLVSYKDFALFTYEKLLLE